MSKKLIAFDLDDTLAISKAAISDRMGDLLVRLLEKYEVCIISGGNFDQFKLQVVDRLEATPQHLRNLHLLPTCGTRYFRYDEVTGEWKKVYAENLSNDQKERTIKALKENAQKLNLWPEKPYGDVIEDRESQITFSALGQKAPAEEKYAWDPDGKKKHALRDAVAPYITDLEVRVGGTTSIDVTIIGVDKAFGMKRLIEQLSISKDEILFIGDKLEEGGNDYPVRAMGIDWLAVERWEDTARVVEGILFVS